MVDSRFDGLLSDFRAGKVDRRTFIVRAVALGVSVGAIGSYMNAAAQDASPEAGALGPGSIGTSVEHISTTDKGTIKVYSSFPLSASYEQIGGDSREAIKYAIELWGGAAGGYAIEYVALDDGVAANQGNWDGALEAENAAQAIGDADCMAYMATYNSGAAMVSIPLTNEAGLVMVSGANTAIQLTRPDPQNPDAEGYPDVLYPSGTRNYCRVIAADDLQGAAGANYAINELGRTRAFVLHDNQTYGKGLADVFKRTFEELGGEVLGFEGYDANAPDYQALMSRIAALGPDIVYAGAIVSLNTSKVLIDMRDVMPDPEEVVFMGPDGLINQAFVDGAGEAAEGALLTFGGLPPESLEALGGAGAEWVGQMRERLGRDPDAYASYWFQVAVVVLNGIDAAADKDRAKVLEAVMGTTDFQGLAGSWSFTETGDADAPQLTVNKVVDGVIKFDAAIAPPA
ncbi:MAG: branched-chain amino acid ABC transporter substrate-binding protein [Thermomicrobiales bacterium]|nr:branched-chain amino acid ABC transporter substrate-binding protein [Thermomicrobiales bacterium]